MTISVIHPSRNRPTEALIARLTWFNSAAGDFEYTLSVDEDDEMLYNYQYNFPTDQKLLISPNHSAIEAINRAAEVATGDLLVVISDDFICPEGWDEKLKAGLSGKSDFIVKTVDGLQRTLITLPIMDRKYYSRFGYVYFPRYVHMYADTEMTVVGHMLGRVITSDLEFPHLHYSTGKSRMDAINVKNDKTYTQGELVFNERLKTNFGIENPLVKFEEIVW